MPEASGPIATHKGSALVQSLLIPRGHTETPVFLLIRHSMSPRIRPQLLWAALMVEATAALLVRYQIGYNWQGFSNVVLGLETDIQGIAANSSSRTFVNAAAVGLDGNGNNSNYVNFSSFRQSANYIGTIRGRIGWLATPALLLYGTGGFSYGGVSLNYSSIVYNDYYVNDPFGFPANHLPASVGGLNFSNTQTGWTIGGGVEWKFFQNWSAKLEYLYYNLGTVNQKFALFAPDTNSNLNAIFAGQVRARIDGNIVRAGVNYHFIWGSSSPVVAKYGYVNLKFAA